MTMPEATPRRFQGAIFDVDGVVVDSPHFQAWRESLRELMEDDWLDLRNRTTWTPDAFTPRVYQQHVAGKPRTAGATAALSYFGVTDDAARVEEYERRKQDMIARLIEAGDFAVFPDALRFVVGAKEAGFLIAAASSSKNASALLRKIRLDRPHQGMTLSELFDVDVSGRDFAHGKPDPEMFLTAAHELGIDSSAAVVFEDAVAGIVAAKRADMGAVGIARADDEALLAAAGADVVVGSLDEVNPRELVEPGSRR
jgi:beta-phosphoglucomutase-like phosphatase (HAD superfamily)